MAILVEFDPNATVSWSDDEGDVLWYGYGGAYFHDATGDTLRWSLDGQALDNYWNPYIISFSAPNYQTEQPYGGFVKMDFGSITISPESLADNWPPPKSAGIAIFYTPDTEDEAVKIYEGNAYLESYDEESVTYQLYAPTYADQLLQTTADIADDTGIIPYLNGLDVNDNEVVLPRAFGIVNHVEPVQLPNDGYSRQTYHLGGLGSGTEAQSIISFTSFATGTKTKVICDAATGWADGTDVIINGTYNFNGTHEIESSSGAEFVIPVAFPTDNSEPLPIRATAFLEGSFSVFEDGVPIMTRLVESSPGVFTSEPNIIVNGDGTFSLASRADKTVTISGTGEDSTLSDIMEWATGQFGIGTYDATYGRATSPTVAYWANSQMPLIDFCSDLCAFFTHYFYIKADQLYLCDMLLDNGTETRDEFEYFVAAYSAPDAVKQIKGKWETKEAFTGTNDDPNVYVKIHDQELVVAGIYPWGQEMSLEVYSDVRSVIQTAFDNILTVMNSDIAEINIPISKTLPDPGKKLTFSDNIMIQDMTTYIRARSLQFDFEQDEIRITGEGVIA